MNRLAVSARGQASKLLSGTRTVLATRLRRAMRAAGLDGAELSLSLSDDRELRALNLAYAGEDHATDVLSFRQADAGVPATRMLGDIVISVPYATRQASTAGRALPGELFHLAVHGLVHLLGYDHRDADEERVMFGYEARLRASALSTGAPRPVRAPRKAERRTRLSCGARSH